MVPRVSEPPVTVITPIVEMDTSLAVKPLPPLPDGFDAPLKSLHPELAALRPDIPRRVTTPDSPVSQSPFTTLSTPPMPLRPRTRSPFRGGHTRSRSSGGSLSAPQMARAHSSPMPNTTSRPLITRPSSPLALGPPSRHRSPMRRPSDESVPLFSGGLDIDQTISENSELDLTPRATTDFDSMSASSTPYNYQTFPRSRRRPMSPLHQSLGPPFSTPVPKNTLRACTSTPSLAACQYNETYPTNYSYSSPGSMPSTPTSLRSRSPSISSLETIPDSPDAELEAENIARLKAAADREDQSEEGMRRRASVDAGVRGGNRDKRKRWSVCGAERRGDLSLETIWEG